jgi:hypothetical protein
MLFWPDFRSEGQECSRYLQWHFCFVDRRSKHNRQQQELEQEESFVSFWILISLHRVVGGLRIIIVS